MWPNLEFLRILNEFLHENVIFPNFRAYLCHFFKSFPTEFFRTGQEGSSRDVQGPWGSGNTDTFLLSGGSWGWAWPGSKS